ncbi:hypothetical protein [Streptomyces sp. NPDC046909]|uniref:hypothetical protein n=1 Tax=Streptomyces sp. NPDC046909 TaxID=3155617 RepID=UPI0033CE8054
MDIVRTTPSQIFHVTGAGAGVNFNSRCGHGDPVLSLHLFSSGLDKVDDIGVLLPSCIAPDLFGMALAYVEASTSPEDAAEFIDGMFARKAESLLALNARRTVYESRGPACCTAAALTRGRDHTCGRTS